MRKRKVRIINPEGHYKLSGLIFGISVFTLTFLTHIHCGGTIYAPSWVP